MWDSMVQSVVPVPPRQTDSTQTVPKSPLPPHLNNLFVTLQDSYRRKRGKEFGTKNQERYYCDIAGCNKSYSRHRDVRRHKEKEHRIDLLGQGFIDDPDGERSISSRTFKKPGKGKSPHCRLCRNTFDSRNIYFTHIKNCHHSMLRKVVQEELAKGPDGQRIASFTSAYLKGDKAHENLDQFITTSTVIDFKSRFRNN